MPRFINRHGRCRWISNNPYSYSDDPYEEKGISFGLSSNNGKYFIYNYTREHLLKKLNMSVGHVFLDFEDMKHYSLHLFKKLYED